MLNGKLSSRLRILATGGLLGHYFLSLCMCLLALETLLQQQRDLSPPSLLTILFSATLLYYTLPYLNNSNSSHLPERALWYYRNGKMQFIVSVILFFLSVFACFSYLIGISFEAVDAWGLCLICSIPLLGLSYYGILIPKYWSVRKSGWTKSFSIAWIWSVVATCLIPILQDWHAGKPWTPGQTGLLLWLKNFMFMWLIGILFDVKDYAVDSRDRLDTLLVRLGLRKTLNALILPLSLIGCITFVLYAEYRHFSGMKIAINLIPFFLLIYTTRWLRKRRNLLFYLLVIDGILGVKAICGILAMVYFT